MNRYALVLATTLASILSGCRAAPVGDDAPDSLAASPLASPAAPPGAPRAELLGLPSSVAVATNPPVDIYVVAHQDDDLLFMNPDIARSIAKGHRVTTVYVTAGTGGAEAGAQARLVEREQGELNAYAYMVSPSLAASMPVDDVAPVLSHWQLHGGEPIKIEASSGIHRAVRYDFAEPLASGASLSLVFLRLDEEHGGGDLQAMVASGTSVNTTGCASGATPACSLRSELTSQTYTRAQLIDSLATLIGTLHAEGGSVPLTVNTLDATGIYTRPSYASDYPDADNRWVDNFDHVASAKLAVSAFIRYHAQPGTAPRSLRQYRGYSTNDEPVNLAEDEGQENARTFWRYYVLGESLISDGKPATNEDPDDPYFRAVGYYNAWPRRKFAVITVPSTATLYGRLMTADRKCLAPTSLGVLTLVDCSQAPEWLLNTRNEIHLAAQPTSCVALGSADDFLHLSPCSGIADGERKTFLVTSDGQIRARGASCVDGNGGAVKVTACAELMKDAQTPWRAPTQAQDWTLIFSPPRLLSTQFSDSSVVASARSYFGTLAIANGKICVRLPGGPGCAAYRDAPGTEPLDGSLDAWAPLPSQPSEYTDGAGWNDASTGGTLIFRAVGSTGALTVCGRGYYGMRCGLGANAAWWTTDFSTPAQWAAAPSRYGSIRLGDVDGDGLVDVCGRSATGVVCGRGGGQSFAAATPMTEQFSDRAGWSAAMYGTTLQMGDLDGDGREDVCGRGIAGLLCARSSGNRLVDDHTWSTGPTPGVDSLARDFADTDPSAAWGVSPAKYRSIRLVDVNRDGLADVCGRGADGIYCALSTGTAFTAKRNVMPFLFDDAGGWNAEYYGATLMFGRLDGDARVDLCARGLAGVWCSSAP
jgi:hypothetical protein